MSKCQLKTTIKTRNQYLDYLIGSIFLEVNRFFALSFENNVYQTWNARYFLPAIEIKDYNVLIDEKKIIDLLYKTTKEHMITFKRLRLFKKMLMQLVVW